MTFIFHIIPFVAPLIVAPCNCFNDPNYLNTETAIFTFGGTPENQFSNFDTCRNGKSQSPIDIREPITPDPNTKVVTSETWNTPRSQEILVNAGHKHPKKLLSFKSKTYQYAFRSFHFGVDNNEGSLHTIFGKRYPLEIHTNFFNVEYGSFSNGTNFPDGTMTMAELYQIGDATASLEIVLNNLKDIVNPNQTAIVSSGTTLSSLVPINSNFYFYRGSATDPKCPEAVIWVVFDIVQSVSIDQMARFRNILKDRRGQLVKKNWRYLQPRNGREIGYRSNSPALSYNLYNVFVVG